MLKVRNLLFLVTLVWFTASKAQTVSPYILNSAGGSQTGSGNSYEWSLGEMVLIDTWTTTGMILTNGLLQPLRILPLDEFAIYPNNIITINADGENDIWFIGNLSEYPDNEVTVYDRIGRVVYRAKPYLNDWEPTVEELSYINDTYYYVLKLNKNNKSMVKRGFITIIK
jgi:gliding motility-associated-like protein